MSVSTTFASRWRRALKVSASGLAAVLLAGCGANEVVVHGQFPQPVLDKLPITLGVYYDPEFRNHEFFDQASSRGESDWIVRTGEAQTQMYDTLLGGMFEKVVMLNELPWWIREGAESIIGRTPLNRYGGL